jgi:hypothetical protein
MLDLEEEYIALWHDESHLNWYVSNFAHKVYDNRLSWVEGYVNLKEFENSYLISSVQKEKNEGRAPSDV